MKVCPACGYIDNALWRHSRFDYNADYMRWDDFQIEYPLLAKLLENKHERKESIEDMNYFYYRRGTGGIEVYRVWKLDFNMPIERKDHRSKDK